MTWNPRLLVINLIVGCMIRLHHGHGLEESHSFWIAQLDSPAKLFSEVKMLYIQEIQFLQIGCQGIGNRTKGSNNNRYNSHLHIPQSTDLNFQVDIL